MIISFSVTGENHRHTCRSNSMLTGRCAVQNKEIILTRFMFGVSTGPKSSFGPNFPCIAFSSINIKQLLGEGFVISRIINVEVG